MEGFSYCSGSQTHRQASIQRGETQGSCIHSVSTGLAQNIHGLVNFFNLLNLLIFVNVCGVFHQYKFCTNGNNIVQLLFAIITFFYIH